MPEKKYTAVFDQPIEMAPSQWRCTYHILGEAGKKLTGKTISVEGLRSQEAARAEADYQATVEIATLQGKPAPKRPGKDLPLEVKGR